MADLHNADVAARVGVIETQIHHLSVSVDKMAKSIETFASRPQQIAWREIAITAGAFLGLFAYVGNYLEGQYSKNTAPLQYRMEQMEKKLCIMAPVYCTK